MNYGYMRNSMSEIFSDNDSARLFQLIHMFQRSALVNMGLMPDIEGKIIYNLPESKEAIDLSLLIIQSILIKVFMVDSSYYSLKSNNVIRSLRLWEINDSLLVSMNLLTSRIKKIKIG